MVCKWLYVNLLHLNLPTCRYAHWFSNYLWWHAEVVLLRLISVSLFREQLDDVQDYFGGLLDVLERSDAKSFVLSAVSPPLPPQR